MKTDKTKKKRTGVYGAGKATPRRMDVSLEKTIIKSGISQSPCITLCLMPSSRVQNPIKKKEPQVKKI